MGWKATVRVQEAAARRQLREAKKRQRELERQAKEQAKLSAVEQARLEVQTYENGVEVLLSVHKEQAEPWDWAAVAATLPPVPPRPQSDNEFRTRQQMAVSFSQPDAAAVQVARQVDDRNYQEALKAHATEQAEWGQFSSLSRRILAGERGAYIEAIQEHSPFAELAAIGSSVGFKVHSPHLVECVLSTDGRQAIPTQVKSLTASGKVSVKSMPKARFVEIYQDYVCGCVLRVARELFALLPVETVLVTASVECPDTGTGQMVQRPFLSVIIPRGVLSAFNFETLDPSDCIMSLTHRGNLKASRKTGEFEFITPLTAADVPPKPDGKVDINGILALAGRLRSQLAAQCAALRPDPEDVLPADGDT